MRNTATKTTRRKQDSCIVALETLGNSLSCLYPIDKSISSTPKIGAGISTVISYDSSHPESISDRRTLCQCPLLPGHLPGQSGRLTDASPASSPRSSAPRTGPAVTNAAGWTRTASGAGPGLQRPKEKTAETACPRPSPCLHCGPSDPGTARRPARRPARPGRSTRLCASCSSNWSMPAFPSRRPPLPCRRH